jgi:hypothetical protein
MPLNTIGIYNPLRFGIRLDEIKKGAEIGYAEPNRMDHPEVFVVDSNPHQQKDINGNVTGVDFWAQVCAPSGQLLEVFRKIEIPLKEERNDKLEMLRKSKR